MEFVQFFPIALAEPGSPPFLMGGPITEEGRILNRLGEDIPEKHGVTARPLVLKSRGPLSIAIMREILAGNGVDGAVLLDATKVVERHGEEEWFSTGRYNYLRDKLNAGEKPFKVSPICHFCMGGIMADEDGDTGVPGLYAAGEVVGGVHGANRHGGNALTDITVFGARAGAAATEYVRTRTLIPVDSLAGPELQRYDGIRGGGSSTEPEEIISELRALMWEKAGIVRDEDSLRMALGGVKGLKRKIERVSAANGREMLVALEAPMALDVAEMIIMAAHERTETRGAHFRNDYSEEDDGWMKTVVLSKDEDGSMVLATRPV
jgi:succinate dehydrogenase/fumarate reductase flavoprotein subunit